MYRDIGPAVWNGGFSTFLAIVPLATSQSHVFVTFFRVRIMNFCPSKCAKICTIAIYQTFA